MLSKKWIPVRTCEADSSGRKNWDIRPEYDENLENNFFLVQDPFNLRKAIIPLFHETTDGMMRGLGTAFGISQHGALLTADHVISGFRDQSNAIDKNDLNPKFAYPKNEFLTAFLSPGLVFGTVNIGQRHFPKITSIQTPIKPGDDPLMTLRGEHHFTPADISVLHTQPLSEELHTLSLDFNTDQLKIGDLVVAVGYPKIDTTAEKFPSIVVHVAEGMFASYGRVTALYPEGRDRTNSTPVFEVDAHWPSGMSGGPVFNAKGHVIGLVSRSIESSDGHKGVGWATWLGKIKSPIM